MKVLAIQNQLTNSSIGLQSKKMKHSTRLNQDFSSDSFSKEKTNSKNISFKGETGSAVGGILGACIGAVAACAIVVATGGAAAPLAGAYITGLIAGGAAGAAAGDAIDD